MPLFGKPTKPTAKKTSFVARPPGDTTPLDPLFADALRKAGLDPEQLMPDPDGTVSPHDIGFPPAGTRLMHSFLFADPRRAFDAIERFLETDCPARIVKEAQGWLVVFDRPDDPSADHASAHQRLAADIAALGGTDRGFGTETVVRTTTTKQL